MSTRFNREDRVAPRVKRAFGGRPRRNFRYEEEDVGGERPGGRGRRSGPGRGMAPGGPRDRDSMRGRRGLGDEEFVDLNLDEILEIEEDEVLEEGPPISDEAPLGDKEEECPPGCAPVDEEDDKDKKDDEPDKKDDEDDDKKDKPDKKKDDDKDDKKEDDDDKEKEASTEAEPTEATTEPVEVEPVITAKWAPIYTEADITRIGKDAEVTLVPFLDQEDPIYVVMANARPVGEIRRSDLGLDEDQHGMFIDESFPKGVIEASEQMGADKVLAELDVRYYATQVTQAQADNAAKQTVQADLEEAFQGRSADLKERFVNNVLLAVEASSKNIFLTNPLRDAIRKNFRQAGLDDALITDLFEDAMQESGAAYFQAMITQADEWLSFAPESLTQVEQMVKDAGYRTPVDAVEPVVAAAVTPPVLTQAPRVPQREAAAVEGTEWDQVRNVLRGTHFTNQG